MSEQLELDLIKCPECGPRLHYGCGYDPEMVKPAMSMADALSATLAHAIETYGWDGAMQRIPGLRLWGQQPPEPERRRNG